MRFAFDLALALGQPDPYKMMSEMPGWLLREWQTYNQFEPINRTRRLEWMMAKLIARMDVGYLELYDLMVKKRITGGRRKYEPEKWMAKYEPPKPVKPVESNQLYAMMRAWAIRCGAKDPKATPPTPGPSINGGEQNPPHKGGKDVV